MDRKLELTGQIVPAEVMQVVEVVNVVNNDLVVLSLLEVVGHFKVLDPFGVEAIHDDFSHPDLLPLGSLSLEEHAHAIGPGERIQVWQVAALKGKRHGIDETLVVSDTPIGRGQDSVVQVTAHSKTARSRLYRALILMLPQASERISNACCAHIYFLFFFKLQNLLVLIALRL